MSLTLKLQLIVVLALALSCFQCQPTGSTNKTTEAPANGPAPKYGYQIVNMWPHDSNAFTQGLILMDGKLLESTGQEGFSSLRRVEPEVDPPESCVLHARSSIERRARREWEASG